VLDAELRYGLTRARDEVVQSPQSSKAWGDLGWLFLAHGMHEQSNVCFAEAAKLDVANPLWPYLIGSNNLLISPEDVIPHLRAAYALAVVPDEKSTAQLQLAEALLERNDLEEAERLFGQELLINPSNPRARFGLGLIAVTRGEPQKAVDHLVMAATSPAGRRKASALLATCYRQLGRLPEAVQSENEASRGPDDLPWPDAFKADSNRWLLGQAARMQTVNALKKQGRDTEFTIALHELARDHPDEQAFIPLGLQQLQKGNFVAAEKTFRTALVKNPDHAGARCLLGVVLYFQAQAKRKAGDLVGARVQFEDALQELRRSLSNKPDLGMAHLHAGLVLEYLDRPAEALQEFEAAIQVIPQNPEAHLALGEALVKSGRTEEAVTHFEAAIRLDPNNERAKVLMKANQKKLP
jgi:tetratricopeptide (TPR) repeat protein